MSVGVLEDPVIWQDVECGAYADDLRLWERLAENAGGAVLELGCGSGRLSLHLARQGFSVTGVDNDAALISELRRRAGAEGLEVGAERADAGAFSLGGSFALVIGAMQLIQLLPGPEARRGCLLSTAAHLAPAGLAAFAIVEGARTGAPPSPALPDAREREGWVYSSLPLGVGREGEALLVDRLRQTVDPCGGLRESRHRTRLQILAAAELEREAADAGLRPAGRLEIAQSDLHVGSVVVLLEA